MSKMPQISIRLAPKLKSDAVKLADTIGFSFNDLVTVLLKKAIRDGGVDLRIPSTPAPAIKLKKPGVRRMVA